MHQSRRPRNAKARNREVWSTKSQSGLWENEGVTPRLQRVARRLGSAPAIIRTAIWDVVAWNRAATVMLIDYASLPPGQRNILRFMFLDPRVRATQYDWESVGTIRGGCVQGRRRARGPQRRWRRSWMSLPAEPRIQGDVARQRRSGPPRPSGQAHTSSDPRPARVRIFGVWGRRPEGPQHGDLQSRDPGGCGYSLIGSAPEIERT